MQASADGEDDSMKFWPDLKSEVMGWKFTPFEKDGKPTAAEVEEYIDLVPPERLPKRHVVAPALRRDSRVAIALQRTGCHGRCPAYTVVVSTEDIVFEGRAFVVAAGPHTAKVDPDAVRELAEKFIERPISTRWMRCTERGITDSATYVLSIDIDVAETRLRTTSDLWVGMPSVISELEGEVDKISDTKRWIEGDDSLMDALKERVQLQNL